MIILDEDYFITNDQCCWNLEKYQVVKEGKNAGNKVAKVVGYYASLERALKAYRDQLVKAGISGAVRSLEQAIEAIRDINDKVDKRIEDATGGM